MGSLSVNSCPNNWGRAHARISLEGLVALLDCVAGHRDVLSLLRPLGSGF